MVDLVLLMTVNRVWRAEPDSEVLPKIKAVKGMLEERGLKAEIRLMEELTTAQPRLLQKPVPMCWWPARQFRQERPGCSRTGIERLL